MKNWPWPTIIAVVSGLAGIAGVVVTPIWGSGAGNEVESILTGLSSLLVFLAGVAGTHVAVTAAKARAAARLNAPPPAG